MAEADEVDGAGGVEGFLRGADGEPGQQDGVVVAVVGGGVDREAEGVRGAAVAQPASILEETAQALRDQSKSQAVVLGNLALAYVRLGQLDAAVARLNSAIDVTERHHGGGGLNIICATGRQLRPWRGNSEVQDVYDRIMTLMAA